MPFDISVLNSIGQMRTPWLDFFMAGMTDLGATKFIIVISLLLCFIFFWQKRYDYFLVIGLSVFGAEGIGIVLKYLIERSRPDALSPLIHFDGFSFPSGHALNAMVFFAVIMYISSLEIKSGFWRSAIFVFLSVIILIVGFSRVYLGAHWPSDVIGSFSIGLIWFTIVVLAVKNIPIINRLTRQ